MKHLTGSCNSLLLSWFDCWTLEEKAFAESEKWPLCQQMQYLLQRCVLAWVAWANQRTCETPRMYMHHAPILGPHPCHYTKQTSWWEPLTNICGMKFYILKYQFRWSEHVAQMPKEKIPKQVLFDQLKRGKWHQGGSWMQYKDSLKSSSRLAQSTIPFLKSYPVTEQLCTT